MRALHTILTACFLSLGTSAAIAAGGTVTGPNEIAPDRYVYYPGTEVLAEIVLPSSRLMIHRRHRGRSQEYHEYGDDAYFHAHIPSRKKLENGTRSGHTRDT